MLLHDTRALDEKVRMTTSFSGRVTTRSIAYEPESELLRVLIEEYLTLWAHLVQQRASTNTNDLDIMS